jgi:tape measure domain-containing protein
MAESIVKLIVDASQGIRSLGRFKKATDEAAKKTDQLTKLLKAQSSAALKVKAATESAQGGYTKLSQVQGVLSARVLKTERAISAQISTLRELRAGLKLNGPAYKRVTEEIERLEKSFERSTTKAEKFRSKLGGLKGAIVSLGVAALTKRMIGQAASFQQTQIRLKALSAEYGEFRKIQQLVKDNAKTFNLSQAEASSQFSDIYARLRPLGKTLEEVQTVYKGFNATAIASGTSAAAASGAFLQLSQALGSGRLAGDEFRSVSEQIPGILGLVADEMGVAVSELKKLGSEGKITSDILINALAKGFEKNKDKIQQILAESPAAKFKEFSNATSELSNAIGAELLPVVTPAVQGLTGMVGVVGKLPGPMRTLTAAAFGLGAALFTASGAAAALGIKLTALIAIAGKVAFLLGPIVGVALAIEDARLRKEQFDKALESTSPTVLQEALDKATKELDKLNIASKKFEDSPHYRGKIQDVNDLKERLDEAKLKVEELTKRRTLIVDLVVKSKSIAEDVRSQTATGRPGGAGFDTLTPEQLDEALGRTKPTKKSKGRAGPDPAVEARRRAEKIAQQLKNSEEMKINLDGQFSVLTEINEREKIRIATMFELSAINRKYNDLTAAALSNEEKRNLEIARGLELGTARIEQGKALEAIQKAEMASQVDFLKNQFAAAAEIDAQIEAQGEKMKDVYKGVGDSIKNGVVDALTAAVDGTKSLAEVASATLKDIGNMFIKLGINQLFNSLGSGGGILGKLFGSAKGNIIAQNKIVPFAKGGIVGEPTIFPLANGTGLMGEAGPEAIMPLKRGPGGRLGVEVASTREQLNNQQAVASTREQLDRQRAVASTREQLNNQQAKAMQPLDIRYESTVINNIEYVTAEQHRKGMAQAAERGRAMTLATLQNSPRTRSKVGI